MRAADWPEIEIARPASSALRMEATAAVYARAKAAIDRLWDGHDAARQRRRKRADGCQPAAAARQYRKAGRRRPADSRPFERPGPAHGRDHRKAGARADSTSSRRSTVSSRRGEGPQLRRRLAQAVHEGRMSVAIFQLGGNLVRSLPDLDRLVPAWRKLRLTVQIETKLNRSCLVHGEVSYILPCLGRIEIDRAGGRGPQAVSVEDSTACIHGSRGVCEPGKRSIFAPSLDHRGARQGDAAAQSEGRLGRVGRRLQPHSRCDRRDLSGDFRRFQHAHVAAGRLPPPARGARSASGRRSRARRTSSRRKRSRPTSTLDPEHAMTFSS